jgi:isopentenyl-diphosphate delta-isomerase
MNQTEIRKKDHVRISLSENVSASHNFWDDIKLIHNALPEINESEIDLSLGLFGKRLDVPLVIAGMTGGFSGAKKINENLAFAAEKLQIGMGVGSQRSALENTRLKQTYSVIKDCDVPLRIANIGASQLVEWGHQKTLMNVETLVDMINADVVAVCLNFLQEIIQPEGETNAKGCYEAIKRLAEDSSTPVIVKESGAGISFDVAKLLSKTKIIGIDIGGAGGTSFAAIEYYRGKSSSNKLYERSGKTFWDWGIPTPISLVETGEATKWRLPILATGGIRNGLDVAKALALGANAAGIAYVLLEPANDGKDATINELRMIIKELRIAMFLVGVDKIEKLKNVGVELLWS